MTSKVEIGNNALIALGEAPIESLADGSKAANAINGVFDLQRDATLRDHPWNFAMTYYSVAADATAPAFEYTYAYTLPVSPFCLRVWRMRDENEYRVVGRKIYTDLAGPLKFTGIARVTDPEEFDPAFSDALALRIAWRVCYRITKSRTLMADLARDYIDAVKAARGADGQEGTPEDMGDGDFLSARIL